MHRALASIWRGRTSVFNYMIARDRVATPFRTSERQLLESLQPLLSTAEALLARLPSSHSAASLASAYGLTAQQRRVTELVMRGLTNREVAQVLGCAELTVRNHLVAIFRKTGVSTRAELVFHALNVSDERVGRMRFPDLERRALATRCGEAELPQR
jgi:DNA-binding CsgD family transcriptional regulator